LRDKFVVGYSGNMGRAHEFATLLDAAHRLRDDSDIMFVFIGAGAQRAAIEEEVKRRGLTNVLFQPYQPRERLALSLSVPDLHIISLRPQLEGLIVPSKFYGIAAAGRPTLFIGDADGEIPRILNAYQCGATVSIGDVDSMLRYIRSLAQGNNGLRDQQGNNARMAFEREFSQSLAVDAWRQLLRRRVGEAYV
jgi:glycosyltransferase involved in cell wall biosynthesis